MSPANFRGLRERFKRRAASGDVSARSDLRARDIVTGTQITHITHIYAAGGGQASPADYKQAISRYLLWLQEATNRIMIRGIPLDGRPALEIPLSSVFVSPLGHAAVKAAVHSPSEKRSVDTASGIEQARLFNRFEETELPYFHRLGQRVALVGGPGSGKTTLLQYIALVLAHALLDTGTSGDWSAEAAQIVGSSRDLPLPVLVPLSLFAEYRERVTSATDPHQKQLTTFISHYLMERQAGLGLPSDFFSILVREGHHLILLLDGLDEVRSPRLRGVVAQSIRDLVCSHPNLRCVLTSRPHSYEGEAVIGREFSTIRLVPWTSDRVDELVSKMCDALTDEVPTVSGQRDRTGESLKFQIRRFEQQYRGAAASSRPPLFTNPLMVRLAFIVHQSGLPFPFNRAELYTSTVNALLTGSYNPDELVSTYLAEHGTSWRRYRKLLQCLAFAIHERQIDLTGGITEESLTTILRPYLLDDLRLTPDAADELLADFVLATAERSPILESWRGRFRFRDHHLQEFLAACHLAEHYHDAARIVEFMADSDRLLNEWWREPFLLAIGYLRIATPEVALTLVLKLVGTGGPWSEPSVRGIAAAELAAASAIEFGVEDANHLRIIAHRLSDLIEDEATAILSASTHVRLRIAAGDALAMLGDPRIGVRAKDGDNRVDLGLFCAVPSGPFVVGSDREEDPQAFLQEEPRRTCEEVSYAYHISRYPVTQGQYAYFLRASDGYASDDIWTDAGLAWRARAGEASPRPTDQSMSNHPITGISWYESQAYCRWLQQRLTDVGEIQVWLDGQARRTAIRPLSVRLPTEMEWEKAARGKDGNRYSWGSSVDDKEGVLRRIALGRTTAVGLFVDERSPYGTADMCGNIWEWCQSSWAQTLSTAPSAVSDLLGAVPKARRAVRGGGFGPDQRMLRAACRFGNDPDIGHDDLGFRPVVISTPA